jgi:uncharacterized protein (TIGR03083 family)
VGDIGRERLALVEWLGRLGPQDWGRPSLCEGWRVKDVLAHLITSFVVSPPQMAFRVLRAGGISQAMNAVAVELGQRDPQELMDILRKNAFSTFRPPGLPASASLADVVVHTADIRWALTDDRTDQGDVSRLEEVLAFVVSRRAVMGFVPRMRLRGLHLVTTDLDWEHGEGERVEGPALAVVMAVLGRSQAAPLLRGHGVPVLLGHR